ncbi:MAG: CvpA family protein [Clostridia bacterium]
MIAGFTYVEIGIGVIALIFFFVGMAKGFMNQLLGFIELAAYIAFCVFLLQPMVAYADKLIPSLSIAINSAVANTPVLNSIGLGTITWYAICGLLVYFIIAIIFMLLRKLAKKIVRPKITGRLDKVLGIALSLGVCYCFVAVIGRLIVEVDVLIQLPEQILVYYDIVKQQFIGGKILPGIIVGNNPLGEFVLSFFAK